jgi:Kae1-associated kinase Bud32
VPRVKSTNQMSNGEFSDLVSQTLEFCRHIAGSSRIVATFIINNYLAKTPYEGALYEVILIAHKFSPKLISYLKSVGNKTIIVQAVDQWIFERDIEKGFLGEAIASKLLFPHFALSGESYLQEKEINLKKRLILELLENLVVNFPELAHRIQIKPQYFMYEVLSNRVKVFPLITYGLASLKKILNENEVQALSGYNEALKLLENEQKILIKNGYVTISKKFISQSQNPKTKIINLSKKMPRTFFTSIFGVLPQLMNIVSQNTAEFIKTPKITWKRKIKQNVSFIDPQKYVFFQTSEGLVSLSDKIDIKGFAEKTLLKGETGEVKVEPIGGMLNDVYLINVKRKDKEIKVLAKRFKDWSGLKWFPLTIWSYGTRSFAVSGQARLSKESAISELLYIEGFNVPKILHVSNAERLVFMEFIEGENLSEAIKRYANGKDPCKAEDLVNKIKGVGEIFANVHARNITLGDTKPDNILVKEDGTIFLIDFEQANQDGDKAWDIALFLYYSGHYLQPFHNNDKAESVVRAFINGYLKHGGSVLDVKKVSEQKYMRVFSIFTQPQIIHAISDFCKKLPIEKEVRI